MQLKKLLPLSAVATLVPLAAVAQDAAAPGFDEIGPYIMTTLSLIHI